MPALVAGITCFLRTFGQKSVDRRGTVKPGICPLLTAGTNPVPAFAAIDASAAACPNKVCQRGALSAIAGMLAAIIRTRAQKVHET
jgi:hypothetical protein